MASMILTGCQRVQLTITRLSAQRMLDEMRRGDDIAMTRVDGLWGWGAGSEIARAAPTVYLTTTPSCTKQAISIEPWGGAMWRLPIATLEKLLCDGDLPPLHELGGSWTLRLTGVSAHATVSETTGKDTPAR